MTGMIAGRLVRFNGVVDEFCRRFSRLWKGQVRAIGAILIPMKNIGFFGLGLLGCEVSLVDQAAHNLAHSVEPPVLAGGGAASPKTVAVPGRGFEHRQKDGFFGREISGVFVEIIARRWADS